MSPMSAHTSTSSTSSAVGYHSKDKVQAVPKLLSSCSTCCSSISCERCAEGPSTIPRRSWGIEEDFEFSGTVLGKGITGAVRRATCRCSGKAFAVKSFDLSEMQPVEVQQLRQEIDMHCAMDHPSFVRLQAVYESSSELHLVLEELRGGELFDRIVQTPYDEASLAEAASQLLQAVAYMHSNGFVHRDIKPENIMFREAEDNHLVLIDFGLSARMLPGQQLRATVGTVQYVAPEVLRGGSYDERVDIWSVGCTLYTMLTGKGLYGGNPKDVRRKNNLGAIDWSRIFSEASKGCQDFIRSLLMVNPRRRPSAQEALRHPWLRQMLGDAALPEVEVSVAPSSPVQPAKTYKAAQATCFGGVLSWLLALDGGVEDALAQLLV